MERIMAHPIVNFILTRLDKLREFVEAAEAFAEAHPDLARDSPENPPSRLPLYLDQQIEQLNIEIPEELMRDTKLRFRELGYQEALDLVGKIRKLRHSKKIAPEGRELARRDLDTYYVIGHYLSRRAKETKLEMAKAPEDELGALWTKMAKLNAVNHGLLFLTKRLYDVCLEGKKAMSYPTEGPSNPPNRRGGRTDPDHGSLRPLPNWRSPT
jgi:hypothetical protein